MHGHRVSSLYQLPKEQDGYRLPDDVRMLWLCNPNNPTGTVAGKEYMRGLIEHNPQVCFIIDQSYEFFTLCPLFSPAEAAEYPNVLLLHSMTKRYAIPGLRLGYVTGSSGLLERLRTNRMPLVGQPACLLKQDFSCWRTMCPNRWMWLLICRRRRVWARRSKP